MAPRNENKMQNKVLRKRCKKTNPDWYYWNLKKPKARKAPEFEATELEEIDPIDKLFQEKE